MRDHWRLSFPRPLAARSRVLTRSRAARFARLNRRACSQDSCPSFSNFVMLRNFLIICILWKDGVNFKSKRFDNPMKKLTPLEHCKSPIMIFLRTKNLMGLFNVSEEVLSEYWTCVMWMVENVQVTLNRAIFEANAAPTVVRSSFLLRRQFTVTAARGVERVSWNMTEWPVWWLVTQQYYNTKYGW